MVRTFRGNHTIYQSCGNTHKLGTTFIVMGGMQRRVIGSTDDDKNAFYAQLEREYDSCPSHDVKIFIRDLNAQILPERGVWTDY